MGDEVQGDVGESFRVLCNGIEEAFNQTLSSADYGSPIEKWAHISIIRRRQDDAYPEIVRYDKRRKVAEFRLKIDYHGFSASDVDGRRHMLCESLLRSMKMCGDLEVSDFDCDRLLQDTTDLCRRNSWL